MNGDEMGESIQRMLRDLEEDNADTKGMPRRKGCGRAPLVFRGVS